MKSIDQAHLVIESGLDKKVKALEKRSFKSLLDQIRAEHTLSWYFMKPKFDEWALRLKLYNNQKRDKDAVGDPIMFTIHQTVLASLYDDRLGVTFGPKEAGDDEVAENLQDLAEYDHEEMEKDMFDYEWDWNASFFGRALALFINFDRDTLTPIPENIDPMTWYRDPSATSVHGNKLGHGRMRFGGREIRMTKREMKDAGVYFNLDQLKADASDTRSFFDENMRLRAAAAGLSDISRMSVLKGENQTYRLIEWFTYYNGKMVLCTAGNNFGVMVRFTELDYKQWPIIDRTLYPIAQSWDGVSIPDLVEDKQRKRSVVQNLSLKSIEAGLYPKYLYDTNKITNRADLNEEGNKYIGVEGSPAGALVPMDRVQIKQEANWILDVLDTAAQRATATPDIQQGINSDVRRTATETNALERKVDTRYALSAKVFGWSEKRFWRQWYLIYKKHFKADLDEKVIRISGAMGPKWRPLSRENIIAAVDPDVTVESRVLSEAKRYNKLQEFRGFIQVALQDPDVNRRATLRRYGKLIGLKKDEIELILPPNGHEIKAQDENDLLNIDKLAAVDVADDDLVHMEAHNRATDTPAKFAHMKAHNKAMLLKKMKPEMAPAPTPAPQLPGDVTSSPIVGGGDMSGGGRPMPTQQ